VTANALLVTSCLIAAVGCSRPHESVPATTLDMNNLVAAVRQYDAAFGEPPSGDSRAILGALRGNKPRGIQFLRTRNREEASELLDPWGQPYDVEMLPAGTVRVRSAGANGRLGDADDAELTEALTHKAAD